MVGFSQQFQDSGSTLAWWVLGVKYRIWWLPLRVDSYYSLWMGGVWKVMGTDVNWVWFKLSLGDSRMLYPGVSDFFKKQTNPKTKCYYRLPCQPTITWLIPHPWKVAKKVILLPGVWAGGPAVSEGVPDPRRPWAPMNRQWDGGLDLDLGLPLTCWATESSLRPGFSVPWFPYQSFASPFESW